jgi:hypothetical protein
MSTNQPIIPTVKPIPTIKPIKKKVNPDISSKEPGCKINIRNELGDVNCSTENYYTSECNKFLLKKELIEQQCIAKNEEELNYLYPNLNDKEFNIKIASKKEFNDTKYDGTIHTDIKEYANHLSTLEYELQPYQQFVKNFLSSQTPYNSLLLFHGLGTGKTCSSIGVCEEMRDYMKQSGLTKRIIIVASENVQDNFKSQLFDERNLKLVNGIWNIKSCIGNKLIKEINPTNIKGVSKAKLISQIKNLINTYYLFMGYGQFANYIIKTMNVEDGQDYKNKVLNTKIVNRLRNEFDERLIIIDEIHNIRIADDAENKKVAMYLDILVKSAMNMRFMFLSATPMYNNYKEIVWLLSIMNINDRRGKIEVSNIFDKNGNFKENGEELLIRKATGYVSFVRGEHPYTFPYRVYPNEFAVNNTFPYVKYPSYQMNLKKIPDDSRDRILYLYLNTLDTCGKCGECQYCMYKYIINHLRHKENRIVTKKGETRVMPSFDNMDKFGYTILQTPLRSLIISYPYDEFKDTIINIPKDNYNETVTEDTNSISASTISSDIVPVIEKEPIIEKEPTIETIVKASDVQTGGFNLDPNELTGKNGLERMMDFVDTNSPPSKGNFSYKTSTINKYGPIFAYDKIGKYSSKIKCFLNNIKNQDTGAMSDGVILIYSQYIDGGLIPVALALEEMGFTRYGNNVKPLFKTAPTDIIDARTGSPRKGKDEFLPARYSMITGDRRLSPDNEFEVKGLTNDNNKDGHRVKVVLISRAGSEGIDFKFIRQIHILDPWYNMNRIEQIIGRGVRNLSHKDLDFEKRNVQIFMYGTILGDQNKEEAADLYVFRFAELKAIQIGKITRLLKETAVDCIINHEQTNFTQEKIMQMIDVPITQQLSTGLILKNFKIGDAPYSPSCDYMANCDYSCRPNKTITDANINEDTYNAKFISMNNDKIIQRIKMLMKESYFYKKTVLLSLLQVQHKYPLVHIYACLSQLIDDETEIIVDKYGRNGRLINIDDYYLFQPLELNNKNASIFDREVPIDYKNDNVEFEINKEMMKTPHMSVSSDRTDVGPDNAVDKGPVLDKENELVMKLSANYELAKEYAQIGKVARGDNDWYKHVGIVMNKFNEEFPEIKGHLLGFLVDHIVDELFYREKLELMNYVYSLGNIENKSFIWYLKSYFDNKIVVTKNFKYYIMYDLSKMKIMILNKNNLWTEAEPEDQREIATAPESFAALSFDINKYNKYVGFLGYKRKNVALVFKTKDMESKRDTGALCEEAGKEKSLNKLNLILGQDKYTAANTKLEKDKKGNIIQEPITHVELCVMQEFYLRYFDLIKKNNKSWFFTPEMALYYKLYKVLL